MALNILVIDDSHTFRKLLVNTLAKLGHTNIREAENGEVGLAKIRRFGCDLVLLDWVMPEMNGLSVLKEIKRDKNLEKIPVIMVTSKSEKPKIINAIKAGAASYIIKPLDF